MEHRRRRLVHPRQLDPAQLPGAGDDIVINDNCYLRISSGLAVSRSATLAYGSNSGAEIIVENNGQWDYHGQLHVGGDMSNPLNSYSFFTLTDNAIARNRGTADAIIGGVASIYGGHWDNAAAGIQLSGILDIRNQATVSTQSVSLTATGQIELVSGGVLRTAGINGSGGISLYGGVIVAIADSANFLNTGRTQDLNSSDYNPALTFDTDGHTVTLVNDFTFFRSGNGGSTTAFEKTGAGTLLLTGHLDASDRGGNVIISAGALGGTGTVSASAVTFAAGARLTPGGDGIIGVMTLNSSVTFAPAAELTLDLATSASYDRVLSDGTITLGAVTVNFLENFDYQTGRQYTFDLLQGVTGDHLASVQWSNLDPQWDLLTASFLDGTLTFQLQQIPEPSTWALLLTGGGILLAGLRRRKKLTQQSGYLNSGASGSERRFGVRWQNAVSGSERSGDTAFFTARRQTHSASRHPTQQHPVGSAATPLPKRGIADAEPSSRDIFPAPAAAHSPLRKRGAVCGGVLSRSNQNPLRALVSSCETNN